MEKYLHKFMEVSGKNIEYVFLKIRTFSQKKLILNFGVCISLINILQSLLLYIMPKAFISKEYPILFRIFLTHRKLHTIVSVFRDRTVKVRSKLKKLAKHI